MVCINCKSIKIKEEFISYSKVNYKICGNCFCAYQDPLIKINYSDTYWQGAIDPDGIKRNFVTERDFKLKNWYGDSINIVNKKKNISVLDIGCGLGYFLSELNESIKKYGVEESAFACEFIKTNYNEINIIKGAIDNISNFNLKFDVVMYYHVIEHIINPANSIALIKKILKPDGLLILGTPNIGSFVSRIFGKNYRHYIPAHICLYNLKALTKLLNDNDFKITDLEKPFFKTDYNNIKNYIRLLNSKKVSPPFYGSIITLYCENK